MMKIAPAAGIVTGGGLLAAVVSSLLGHDISAISDPVLDFGYGEGDVFSWDNPIGDGMDKPSGEISHHPALFKGGLSVGVPLADRLKIVTGLEYSRYRSDFGWHFSGGTTVGEKRQVVRYLGVPLRLDWSLAKNHMFDVYVGAGAQADYCIGADLIDSRTKEAHRIDAVKRDGFVFSLLAAGGIQVNVHKLIGLYLEPELVWTGGKPTKAEENYYPWYVSGLLPGPDNTKLQTYRTEHPFMFSVSTGLRINLGK
jgi:RNA polymerase sigma-70 factor (ECF subfamily)